MTESADTDYIAALIEERKGYMQAGHEDRAAQVTDELRRIGHEAAPPAARAVKRTPRSKETR